LVPAIEVIIYDQSASDTRLTGPNLLGNDDRGNDHSPTVEHLNSASVSVPVVCAPYELCSKDGAKGVR
jgi:hypothetical protein